MSFEKKYPDLYQFIGGWFPDADFEEMSDEDVVKQFCDGQTPEEIASVIRDAQDLLMNERKFLPELEKLSNIFFEDDTATDRWLTEIIGYLKQETRIK